MSSQPGLRERKKQRTRETIARVAVDLFAERGYHATTLADIAEAADVSTRTIFGYFASKEDILFCDFPELKAALAGALTERPEGKDTLETVRDFVLSAAHLEKGTLHGRRAAIIEADETLRSHKRARLAEIEDLVSSAIAKDLGADADDMRPRLVAASLIAALEALDDRSDRAVTMEDAAMVVDPVIAFLRGGLEALTTPARSRSRR
jgi:AcrR family transcriptional regulator